MGNEPGRGKRAQKCKKDVFLTERTQDFGANKGLISSGMLKPSAILMPNERELKPKRGQEPPFIWPPSVVCEPKKRRPASLTGGLGTLRIQPSGH